ncbi:unnamed protein product [Caenorhabditis angaria]|uniref:lysozyme n=1 Tax=Caenorhabditis angaria TaxID=860376 RepID=A0A9P1INT3_9PELO|nr:unnamed protein product [Caenorhabditis angaria]
MSKFCLILICCTAFFVEADAVLMFGRINETSPCLIAMCYEDSDCVPVGCDVDVYGRIGCGYFRLNKYQYQQCYMPDRGELSEEDGWMRCAHSYECSATCIKTVAARFRVKCYAKSVCETIARLHDGGANGCRDRRTIEYWKKVESRCGDQCNSDPIFKRH